MESAQPKNLLSVSNNVFQFDLKDITSFLKLRLDNIINNEYPDYVVLDAVQQEILGELYSLLPLTQQIECDFAIKNAKRYFQSVLSPKLDPAYRETLLGKIDAILAKALMDILLNKFEDKLLVAFPSMMQEPKSLRLHHEQINPARCVVLPENTMLVCSPNQQDEIIYIGFSKIHTCYGIKIQHALGRQMLMHVANNVEILPLIKKALDKFEDVISLSRNFDVRIIGGFRDNTPGLKLDDSSRFLASFLIRLIIYMQKQGCSLSIQSLDCFEQLANFREYNEKKSQEIGVGCLFDRNGVPLFIHNPQLGYLPYTTIGNSVLVDEPGKRFTVWSRLMLFMEFLEKDVVLIYNDVDPGFNRQFLRDAQYSICHGFIRRIMDELVKRKLVALSDDKFIINIIENKLETWEKCYSLLFNKPSEPIMNHMIHYLNIYYNRSYIEALSRSNLTTVNLPEYMKDISLENTFFDFILNDGCIDLAIRENINGWCANFISSQIPQLIKNDLLNFFNRSNISLWHLSDELYIYQLMKKGQLPFNLIARIIQEPGQIDSIISDWQNQIYKAEIYSKIIDKIIPKNTMIDRSTTLSIENALLNEGIKLLPFLHERNMCKPSLSDLINKLATCIEGGKKWDRETADNINKKVNEIVKNWISEVKILPIYSQIEVIRLQEHSKNAIIHFQKPYPYSPSK